MLEKNTMKIPGISVSSRRFYRQGWEENSKLHKRTLTVATTGEPQKPRQLGGTRGCIAQHLPPLKKYDTGVARHVFVCVCVIPQPFSYRRYNYACPCGTRQPCRAKPVRPKPLVPTLNVHLAEKKKGAAKNKCCTPQTTQEQQELLDKTSTTLPTRSPPPAAPAPANACRFLEVSRAPGSR